MTKSSKNNSSTLNLYAAKLFISAIFICLFLFLTANSHASSQESLLKAVFIEKFTYFIEWSELDNEVTICAYGVSETNDALKTLTQSNKIKGQKASFLIVRDIHSLQQCQILFISQIPKENINNLRTQLHKKNLLTIGDSERFNKLGVIINFTQQEGKLRFEINRVQAQNAGLKISSRLLKLASRVYQEDENQ